LLSLLSDQDRFVCSMDRINRKLGKLEINILMARMVIPLCWTALKPMGLPKSISG
jgi:hypothetical protein